LATQHDEASRQLLGTLFSVGTAAGRTDGQLLEWFATGGPEASELAFTALVERHGAMVLRTCRAVLRDEHLAQDSFQATFLVLVKRGRGLWVRDSLAPWLHRVAHRAALRARRDSLRQRSAEQTRNEAPAEPSATGAVSDDLGRLLHAEIERLPERYRVAVVLCDLEERTYEEAARHLGCPVGTVKSRLARGREQLRDRLTRRGLAPGVEPSRPLPRDAATPAVVPATLAGATIRAAIKFVALPGADAGAVSATVAALAQGTRDSMALSTLRSAVLTPLLLVLVVAVGGLAATTRLRTRPIARGPGPAPTVQPRPRSVVRIEPPAEPRAITPARAPEPALAWRRVDTYEPPDFDRFFPDDGRGGMELDALWTDPNKDKRPVAEVLRIVRNGLRRTREPRDQIIAWVGGSHIWGKSPQHPDAVEILYHAADFRTQSPAAGVTRYNAVYYGLSVVEPKPPAVLRTLVEMSMAEKNDWGRVAWGARSQRDELLAYLKPYLADPEPATREKAAVLERVLSGDPDSGKAVLAWTRKKIRTQHGDRLPELRAALTSGESRERLETLQTFQRERIGLIMDDSFIDAFAACAGDKDPKVRSAVSRILGLELN
jgi:RNA polymerase sigma factor (sigma-70 family)